jgi:hypothetical protein
LINQMGVPRDSMVMITAIILLFLDPRKSFNMILIHCIGIHTLYP